MLGVGVDVDENGLKAGFRQVVKKIHPDRNSYLADDQNNVQVEVFVRVRQVYEALRNPNVRFAYDRFVVLPSKFQYESVKFLGKTGSDLVYCLGRHATVVVISWCMEFYKRGGIISCRAVHS